MTRSRPATPTALRLTFHLRTDPVALANSLSELVSTQRRSNKIIQELNITFQPTFHSGRLLTAKGRALMKAFASLPDLKTVVFRGSSRTYFPVAALIALFSQAPVPKIVRFCLFQMTLIGTPTEYETFARAVDKHRTLEIFDIDTMHIVESHMPPRLENIARGVYVSVAEVEAAVEAATAAAAARIRANPNLDPLIKALLKLPSLKVLLLGGNDPSSLQESVSKSLIIQLFQSKTIERLSLVNFSFSLDQVIEITQALEVNKSLRNLCLSCGNIKGFHQDQQQVNASTMNNAEVPKELEIKQSHRLAVEAFATMLRVNQALQKLILYIPNLDQDDELNLELFRAVGESKTLKGVYLGSLDNASPQGRSALIEMLESNYVLQEFGFVCANPGVAAGLRPYSVEVMQEMALLLRLNKAGRGRLLQDDNATLKDWVNALVNVKDDLNSLYYLLSRKPSLIDPAPVRKKQKQDRSAKSNSKKRSHGEERDGCDRSKGAHVVAKRKRLYRAVKYTGISYK